MSNRPPKTFRWRRYSIVVMNLGILVALLGSAFYLVYINHPARTDWIQVVTIVAPLLAIVSPGWLGIESSKMKGGQAD